MPAESYSPMVESDLDDAASGGSSDYPTDKWGQAKKAAEMLVDEHDGAVDRSLEASCPWCMTIALLQLARSTGWNFHFSTLALRQVIRLGVAVIIQITLVWYFGYSLMTLTPYGGQPWLCQMGRGFVDCHTDPTGPNCIGPGGREYHQDDLFSDFNVWSTRMYVRDSLKAIFGDDAGMQAKIQEKVVPGEFGLEDDFCRLVCLLLLGIQVQSELRDVLNMLVTVTWLPCNNKPWLRDDPSKDDGVRFFYGGIPCWMKGVSYLIIMLRFSIAFYVGALGVRFLLNTAAIQDLIFNSLALTFIFDLDELVQTAWSTKEPRKMMDKLESFTMDRRHCYTSCCDCLHKFLPLPFESFLAMGFVAGCMIYNFHLECTESVLGGMASKAVYAIEFGHYSVFPWWQKTTEPHAQWCPPETLVANSSCHY